jgi:hypothetical protein
MKLSRSLSDSFRLRSRRERWVVGLGAVVSVAALGITQGILPLMDRWTARERAYVAERGQWQRLQSLVASEALLRRAVDTERRADRDAGGLLTTGATPALGASSLQVLLRTYAEQSSTQLDRVDVAAEPTPSRPGLLAIPVRLQGQGDIYGLTDFLFRLQHGERLLVIDEISVTAGYSPGGYAAEGYAPSDRDRLVWNLRAHGLYPAGAPEGP